MVREGESVTPNLSSTIYTWNSFELKMKLCVKKSLFISNSGGIKQLVEFHQSFIG